MRLMNLPALPVSLHSREELIKSYLERVSANNARWPHASMLLSAYLAWPNNAERRNSLVATYIARFGVGSDKGPDKSPVNSGTTKAFGMFGGVDAIAGVAFDQLTDEIAKMERQWLLVADIFQLIVDMAHDDRAVLRRGASISKAIDLCEFERGLPGHSQLRAGWSAFRDVAHVLTASAYLACQGLAQSAAPEQASILNPIFVAPDLVISLASGLQQFGLQPKPARKETPILNPASLWQIPPSHQPENMFIVYRRLTEAQLAFLEARRAFKKIA